jgi:Zn-finger nucleic acid-binding protein
MANCSNCAAPLPQGSILCEYCGSRNDIDLKGVNYYTTHEADSERICPRCGINLETIDLKLNGKFLIERCGQCLGLFFDPGELEALLDATVSNVFTVNKGMLENISSIKRCSDYGISYIPCPVCKKLMNRVNFGAKSGVIVDRCKEHGVWLDGGELRHLFEWMKAGGKILDQQLKEEKKRLDEQQEKEKNYLPPPSSSVGEYGYFDEYGGTLRSSDPDLFDIVKSAIRFFTK